VPLQLEVFQEGIAFIGLVIIEIILGVMPALIHASSLRGVNHLMGYIRRHVLSVWWNNWIQMFCLQLYNVLDTVK
jgi:hypothetical protein